MFQLVYVSSATWPMNNEDLNRILDMSRANNRRLGVTGLLLHIDQGFLQVLEGPKDAVLMLFARIQKDARHIGLRVLIQQESTERLFADWLMGFERLTPNSRRTADIFEITQEAITTAFPPERAVDLAILLRNFYRVNAGNFAA
jgi:hypothetical protein